MKYQRLPLTIDTSLPLPIHSQIINQIKVLIQKNYLRPLDFLPPATQLAESLSVNKNTIQSSYTQLKQEGYLIANKGNGTQVSPTAPSIDSAFIPLIQETIHTITNQNYSVNDFLLACLAFNQLFAYETSAKRKYLFLECRAKDCQFYLDELTLNSKATIKKIDLHDLPAAQLQEEINTADVIVTQNHLLESLNEHFLIDQKQVISVSNASDILSLVELIRG